MPDYNFEVGQKVVVSGVLKDNSIDIIEKITPTGRIVTKHSGTYNSNGNELGSGYKKRSIEPATPEKIHSINTIRRRSFLKRYDWAKISDELVTEIVTKIREFEKENGLSHENRN